MRPLPLSLRFVFLVGILASCTGPTEPTSHATVATAETPSAAALPPHAPATPGARQQPQRAPLVLSVSGTGPMATGTDLDLKIALDRTATDPTQLNVTLPPGADLVSGSLAETITDTATHVERVLRIHLPNGVPPSDVQVTAQTSGVGYGARAAASFRFGRADPLLAQPVRTGAPLMVGGKSLGQPIPVK